MLALKLLIVPSFIGAITLAARRWGPKLAGRLAGFPVVTGPILFFLALEQSVGFATQAATASVSAVIACSMFCLAYAWVSHRYDWPLALLAALSGWFAMASPSAWLQPSLLIATALTLIALVVIWRLLPHRDAPPKPRPADLRELLVRMLTGAVLVLIVTTVASKFGPRWSGLFAMFPVLVGVLSVFSQRREHPDFLPRLYRGMLLGYVSFTAFCVALALLLPRVGIAASFALAMLAALLAQFVAPVLLRRPQAPAPTEAVAPASSEQASG